MAKYCKYYQAEKLVTYNGGLTWHSLEPPQYGTGSLIERNSPDCGYVPPGYDEYFTLEALENGWFQFSGTSSSTVDNNSIQYSTNSGSTWGTLSRNNTVSVSSGQKVYFKSTTLSPSTDGGGGGFGYGIGRFISGGRFNARGNIMSLYYGDNFQNNTSLNGKSFALCNLFSGCTNLISAENLVLPSTALPYNCYRSMFSDCTSLTTPPALPATTLGYSCYYKMFNNCSSLTTAPQLPARTLTEWCYYQMFFYCTSLTTAPELPATTLAKYCYNNMFVGCTSLNYIKCLATDISAYQCTNRWVYNVSSSGTFVKESSMSNWTTGYDGIPSNWTVQNA